MSTSPDEPPQRVARWRRNVNRLIAAEISAITRYCGQVAQWRPRPEDRGHLLGRVEGRSKAVVTGIDELGRLACPEEGPLAVLLNGNLNHHDDIQSLLDELKPALERDARVIAVAYNPFLRPLYVLANRLGIRTGELPTTFLTETDLRNLAALSGFEVVRIRPTAYVPWALFGGGTLVNRLLPVIPLVRRSSFASVVVLRPIVRCTARRPSLSIVIPARNERGNVEDALGRIPDLGTEVEVIFVEGHSTDGTWEAICAAVARADRPFRVRALRQAGRGKGDAVRLGFEHATGDLLTILDADLTVPPEMLGRFVDAYCEGLADFVNGTRLVYPMERAAMRFLNRLGNVFFAKSLSRILDVRLGDVLCGTKLVSRRDYARIVAWRKDFGDFDPFGDFELLFPAAALGLGIVDVPIRYRARTYGTTNILRFRHGAQLLRMAAIGFGRIKLGRS